MRIVRVGIAPASSSPYKFTLSVRKGYTLKEVFGTSQLENRRFYSYYVMGKSKILFLPCNWNYVIGNPSDLFLLRNWKIGDFIPTM